MQPRQMRDTVAPVLPSLVYSMITPVFWNACDSTASNSMTCRFRDSRWFGGECQVSAQRDDLQRRPERQYFRVEYPDEGFAGSSWSPHVQRDLFAARTAWNGAGRASNQIGGARGEDCRPADFLPSRLPRA